MAFVNYDLSVPLHRIHQKLTVQPGKRLNDRDIKLSIRLVDPAADQSDILLFDSKKL